MGETPYSQYSRAGHACLAALLMSLSSLLGAISFCRSALCRPLHGNTAVRLPSMHAPVSSNLLFFVLHVLAPLKLW